MSAAGGSRLIRHFVDGKSLTTIFYVYEKYTLVVDYIVTRAYTLLIHFWLHDLVKIYHHQAKIMYPKVSDSSYNDCKLHSTVFLVISCMPKYRMPHVSALLSDFSIRIGNRHRRTRV
jgi:hypothetical protein